MAGLSQDNLLKDVFNAEVVRALSDRIGRAYPAWQASQFERETLVAFPELSFMQRSHHLCEMLHRHLPTDPRRSIPILVKTLGPVIEPGVTVWENFHIIALCEFVSRYGHDHFDLSMGALYEMTRRFSAEGSLRTFLEVDYERCMQKLNAWVADPDPHVRRLVSEGTRSRLPMTGRIKRFQENPRPVIALLEKLKDDSELYVRRSVANNINDIAKDNPDVALATLRKWARMRSPRVQWVVRHAARSLIKQGHPEILEILGAPSDIRIELSDLRLKPKLKSYRIGNTVELGFQLRLREKKAARVIVDYVMHYQKANGKQSEKVFKLRDWQLQPGEQRAVIRKHALRNTSGRTHYPGAHRLELQINGKRYGSIEFQLKS